MTSSSDLFASSIIHCVIDLNEVRNQIEMFRFLSIIAMFRSPKVFLNIVKSFLCIYISMNEISNMKFPTEIYKSYCNKMPNNSLGIIPNR